MKDEEKTYIFVFLPFMSTEKCPLVFEASSDLALRDVKDIS